MYFFANKFTPHPQDAASIISLIIRTISSSKEYEYNPASEAGVWSLERFYNGPIGAGRISSRQIEESISILNSRVSRVSIQPKQTTSNLKHPLGLPMMKQRLACILLLAHNGSINTDAFGMSTVRCRSSRRIFAVEVEAGEGTINPDDYETLPPDDADVAVESAVNTHLKDHRYEIEDTKRTELKRRLYQLAASYDRGFGATPKARKEADDIIQQLGVLNPTQNSARGVDGDVGKQRMDVDDDIKSTLVPLKAIWRMIWTSAFDVVSLGASPFAGT